MIHPYWQISYFYVRNRFRFDKIGASCTLTQDNTEGVPLNLHNAKQAVIKSVCIILQKRIAGHIVRYYAIMSKKIFQFISKNILIHNWITSQKMNTNVKKESKCSQILISLKILVRENLLLLRLWWGTKANLSNNPPHSQINVK